MARAAASCATMPARSISATNGRRAAVHDRHFRPVEFDDGIVDAAAGERRHQVLDRADLDALAVGQHGRERRFDRVAPDRPDLGAERRLRRNTMPLSGAAGRNVIATGCARNAVQYPGTRAADLSVRADAIPISPNMRSLSKCPTRCEASVARKFISNQTLLRIVAYQPAERHKIWCLALILNPLPRGAVANLTSAWRGTAAASRPSPPIAVAMGLSRGRAAGNLVGLAAQEGRDVEQVVFLAGGSAAGRDRAARGAAVPGAPRRAAAGRGWARAVLRRGRASPADAGDPLDQARHPPFGPRRGLRRRAGGDGGWVDDGTGRAGPASTGRGAIKAPLRIAAVSAASAAGMPARRHRRVSRVGRDARGRGLARRRRVPAFCVRIGWV